MKTILRHPLESFLCVLIGALSIITFSQVVARYVFEAPLSWSEELARFLLLWLAMLSSAYAFKIKSHFALQFVTKIVPSKIQKLISVLVPLLVISFLSGFVFYSIKFVLGVKGHLAPALQIPMEIPYSSSIAGSSLMLYYVVKTFINDIRSNPSIKKN
tara:strand:+ start:19 stop:492 length:474 start_codon:yes stop_codon:yes gene_type:complete